MHNRNVACIQTLRERLPQSQLTRVARNFLAVIPRLRPEHHATTPPERRSKRSRARAASTLLSPRLFVRAGDFAHGLGAGGSHSLRSLISHHNVMHGLRAATIFNQRKSHVEFSVLVAVDIFNRELHGLYFLA